MSSLIRLTAVRHGTRLLRTGNGWNGLGRSFASCLSCDFTSKIRATETRSFPSGTSHLHLNCRSVSTAESSSEVDHLNLSTSNLGLLSGMVLPSLASIRQLPEVESALQDTANCASTVMDNLKRAVEVFEMMQSGGPEHCAVLALLAQHQQKAGMYTEAFETLDKLDQLAKGPSSSDLPLAKAKVLWYQGNFSKAFKECEKVADEDYCPTIRQTCALNGMGASSLMLLPSDDLNEADAVRELLRVGCKTAENAYRESPLSPELGLASAACYGNLGVAQFAYSQILVKRAPDMQVPMDAALQAWRDGLNLLEQVESAPNLTQQQVMQVDLIRARLHANMALALLDEDDDELLSTASEYARVALSIYEKQVGLLADDEQKACLGRALTLVARCYVKADSAVTAEGLFQTANESLSAGVSPLEMIDLRDSYEGYASLCNNWDKRKGDATRLEERSNEINESLVDGWRGKRGIYSGMWFFTPSDFY